MTADPLVGMIQVTWAFEILGINNISEMVQDGDIVTIEN